MLATDKMLRAFGRDFPKRLAKVYGDYVGLMCGTLPKQLKKVAIVLDMEAILMDAMIKAKPDLIITHHPFIYGAKAKVLKHDSQRRAMVDTLAKHRIPVYSLHTNFDAGRGGMNDALATTIGLKDIIPLTGDPLARGGKLTTPMPIMTFAKMVKRKLALPYAHLIAEGKSTINAVAIIGGGGAKFYPLAQAEGYDIFLSGDSAHHVRRGVVNAHYNYLEIPHEVETIFIPTMATYLRALDPTIELITDLRQTYPALV